jgi:regulator of sigma E protease
MQVGDEVLAINNIQKPRFTDLMTTVALSDLEKGVRLKVARDDQPPFDLVLHPTLSMGLPKIGITPPRSLKLFEKLPARPGSSAAQAEPALLGGDLITAIDGQSVTNYAELDHQLSLKRGKPIEVTVRRGGELPRAGASTPRAEMVTVTVPVSPVLAYGLEMEMGPIVAVQQNSAAEKAGFQVGDRILKIDGAPAGDPMTLPDRLHDRAGESVTFTVRRADEPPREITITMPAPTTSEWPKVEVPNVPRAVSGLGVAYQVMNTVVAVEPGSPAAEAQIEPGDTIVKAELLLPEKNDDETEIEELVSRKPLVVEFGDTAHNWPYLLAAAQWAPGAKLKLTLEEDREVELAPVASTTWFNPERGFLLDPLLAERKADNLQQAFVLGGRETLDWTLQVYRFLQKLGRQIPLTELGGPGAIVGTASAAADAGFSQFLIFLVMLSANLAVLNFLPIPMLDGGHMVFLILEAIRRKPVSEKVVLAFHYAGFLFIVTLMCFVLFLDIRRFLL